MNYLLAVASALLFTLSFPRYDLPWLMPVALAPLLVAVSREHRPARRFLLGWITGIGCLAGVTDWIRFVISYHGGLGTVAGWAVFFLYCLAKGLYFGVFGWLAGPVMRSPWAVPAVAALWVAVDITVGSVGYTWVTPGNAGADMSLPMRLAPYTGVHGLSFVFLMMTASLALVFLRRPRSQLLWLLLLPLLILAPPLPEPSAGSEHAVVVQPNLEDIDQWTTEGVDRFTRRLVLRSMEAVLSGDRKTPALVVWPEMPAPFYYDDDPGLRQHTGSLARVTRTPLLFGTVWHTRDRLPLNSALLLNASGQPVSRYDKIELVPFGEFVPWPFTFAGKITSEVGDFQPGSRVVVSPVNGHRIGSFICYESAFPWLVRRFARDGAEVMFNLSNDGYFGRSASARGQHLLLVRMRAAENSRWIIRATNDGITASVDPAGRVVKRLPDFVEAAERMPFSFRAERSVYSLHGDWFGWGCVGVSAVVLGRNWLHRRGAEAGG